eukprot:gene7348-6904_t
MRACRIDPSQLQQHKSKFQQDNSSEKRSAESAKVRVKYPDRIP